MGKSIVAGMGGRQSTDCMAMRDDHDMVVLIRRVTPLKKHQESGQGSSARIIAVLPLRTRVIGTIRQSGHDSDSKGRS